jgi:hypothetical protein
MNVERDCLQDGVNVATVKYYNEINETVSSRSSPSVTDERCCKNLWKLKEGDY